MSEPFVFDSRCEYCKSPYGAVTCSTEVYLRVRPLAAERFSHCSLILREEFSGRRTERELRCDEPEGDRIRYSLTFSAPDSPELVWYHFRLWREDGSGCLLDRSGYRSSGGPDDWQITVYDGSSPSPDWFGEGVTYQIFPDRFCRLTVPSPKGMIGNRTVHADWNDPPEWRPDPDGEFRCRDFFGGSLAGIASKLDLLSALHVTTLYLNPIFFSASNHRYNTADYRIVDPMLGTEADFRSLCDSAHRRGIRVILDGVFNHTGSDSIYFNANGSFSEPGAAQSRESHWYDWYRFQHWPDQYDAWWGIRTLPAINEENPDYRAFIADGTDSVVRHWLRCGADGWRLDVADELPDDFIADIRRAMTQTKPDAFLLGEVWEDGTTKIAYSLRRKYLLGNELNGLMNYPFRNAALQWLRGGDAADFCETMETLREHYPPAAFYSAMNFLGTHDTPRILTLLGAENPPRDQAARAAYRLPPQEYARARALLMVAVLLLYTFPGSPTIYYGDEAGAQGFQDPLNRGTYPWGHEDSFLRDWYEKMGALRAEHIELRRGSLRWLCADGPGMAFAREAGNACSVTALNAGESERVFSLPWESPAARDLLSGQMLCPENGRLILRLAPRSGMLIAKSSG